MKQTEITVQIFDSVDKVEFILKELGFTICQKIVLKDFYYSRFGKTKIKEMQYKELIDNSILLRNITGDINETELIFKNKILDKDENVISEEKYKTKVDNFENTLKIFKYAKLNNWCKLTQNIIIYKKGEIELCLQDVEGLGVFIEYEEEPSLVNLSSDEKIKKMITYLKSLKLNFGEDFFCKKVYMKYLLNKNKC